MLMLILYAGEECYCCSCDLIIEIVPRVSLRQIPNASPSVSGLLNYGGESIPVIDLSMLLNDRSSKERMHTRIILFRNPVEGTHPKALGLIAENIVETREIDENQFKEPGIQIRNYLFLDGVYSTENESIQNIKIDLFFNSVQELING